MSTHYSKYFLLLSLMVILAGGCAKQELVKKDGMIPPPATAKPVVTASVNPAGKESGVKNQSVKEEQITDHGNNGSATAKTDSQIRSAMEKIFFDFDSYALSQAARDTLVKNAALMKQGTAGKVRIEGNCDERGSDEYNLALGEKRAREAMKYLVTMGVPANRLSTISYGKEKPVDQGHTEEAWAQNRRDEFVVISR